VAELVDHLLAMGGGVGQPLVVRPLLAHLRRPVLRGPEPLRQRRVLEQQVDAPGQVALEGPSPRISPICVISSEDLTAMVHRDRANVTPCLLAIAGPGG
jgi:hypothetical protein